MLSETMPKDAGMSCKGTWKPHSEETIKTGQEVVQDPPNLAN